MHKHTLHQIANERNTSSVGKHFPFSMLPKFSIPEIVAKKRNELSSRYGWCGKNSGIIVMRHFLLSCLFSTDGNSAGCLVHREDNSHYPDSRAWFLQSHHSPTLLKWNCLQYHSTETKNILNVHSWISWAVWLQMAQQFWRWCWQTVHSLCSLSWGSILTSVFVVTVQLQYD